MQSLEGIALVLTFIYRRCPLPDFCPLMDRHFATVQARSGRSRTWQTSGSCP